MKRFRILTLALLMLTSTIFAYADNIPAKNNIKNLSLELAISEAVKNSNSLKTSDLEIQVKEVQLDEASYNERKYKHSDYSLGTVQGFQLDENMMSKQAEYALQEEKLKKDYKVDDLKYNVTRAYYGAIQARDYLNVSNNNLENVQRSRDIVKKKLDLGVVSKSELIMADIALDEAKSNVEKAKLDVDKAIRGLNMILNYPLNTKIELTSNFKEENFNSDINKDLENSYKTRFDMIQLNNNYELVKLDFKTNSIAYPENTFVYKYKQSSVAKIENILGDAKKGVEFEITNKYDAIISAKKQIQIAKTNVERAKEGLRLRELSYNSGMGTLLEVQQAQTQLYTAQTAFSGAISNYNLSILDYNQAVKLGDVN